MGQGMHRIAILLFAVATLGACKDKPAPAPSTSASRSETGSAGSPERWAGPNAGRVTPPKAPERQAPGERRWRGDPDDPAWQAEREQRRAEREQRRADQRAEQVAQFDTDGDGTLSDTEREAMRQTRIDDRMAVLDADGDGKITQAELDAMPERGRRGGRRGLDLSRVDTDGDGTLSRAELEASMQRRGGRRGGPDRDEAAEPTEP